MVGTTGARQILTVTLTELHCWQVWSSQLAHLKPRTTVPIVEIFSKSSLASVHEKLEAEACEGVSRSGMENESSQLIDRRGQDEEAGQEEGQWEEDACE